MAPPTTTREAYYKAKVYMFPGSLQWPRADEPVGGSQTGSYQNDLAFRDSKLPSSLKPFEVLVKIHAVSLQVCIVSRAPEWYPGNRPEELVPLSDMSGEVVAVGEDVKDRKVKDRVSSVFAPDHLSGVVPSPTAIFDAPGGGCNGMLTQYRIFKDHSLVAIPDHLSFEEASTLPCAAVTAYNALMGPTPVKAGDTVLIQGTGGVSIFALQFAVASGATVILTSSSDEKLEIGKKLGAKYTINYKTNPDWDKEVLRITHGLGVDYTLEMGGPGTFLKSIGSTKYAGLIAMVGVLDLNSEANNASIIYMAMIKELTLRGLLAGSRELFRSMLRLMTAHPETTRPVIDKVFEFKDSIEAFGYLESQRHVGKVVIRVA
ncbi:alcohol dehydrogenase superfamily protein [Marasmius fiardii PR-910]|nr:alcohol dehydrogenase superfamily protein [Marasmius fiardii PR-910]